MSLEACTEEISTEEMSVIDPNDNIKMVESRVKFI
jgi:hypothetical protein